MKNSLLNGLMALIMVVSVHSLTAQTRYLDEVFTDAEITITSDVVYGSNINFLISDLTTSAQLGMEIGELSALADAGTAFPATYYDPGSSTQLKVSDLLLDVYAPSNGVDTETERPVIVYLHTGNFLPPPVNGSMMGTKGDSLVVDLCRSWAKRGYVAVSVSYRLGWNPVAPDIQTRRGTLLNAVYRAIHDTKQAVRFMKEDANGGNTYGIDVNRISLFGEGSGGYMSQAYVTLDKSQTELYLDKFLADGFSTSYIDTTNVGPPSGFGPANSLNLYRDNGFDSEVHFSANAGGALADESWLEAGDVPMVAFHAVRDDFAPFTEGTVIVPTTQEEVVDVHGSNFFIQKANDLGNNNVFASLPDGDPYTDRARSLYGETFETANGDLSDTVSASPEGLFSVVQPLQPFLTNISAPWQWWNPNSALSMAMPPGSTSTTHQIQLQSNPDMSEAQSIAFQDTINGFMLPRMACALSLPGNPCIVVEPPVNDNICDAIATGTDGTVINADNTDATVEDGAAGPSCSFGGDPADADVWYSFVAPESGGVTITTYDTGGVQDTQVAVYSSSDGTCSGELTEVACGEDIAPPNYFTEFDATDLVPGDTYFVQFDTYQGEMGTFDFTILTIEPAPDCEDNTYTLFEDFESYVLAPIVGQSDDFIPWPNATDSSDVSDMQAFSGTQSLKVGPGGAEDQVLSINQELCSWETSWKMYVPSDSSAYFNIQGTALPGGIFIVEALFNVDPMTTALPGTPGEGQLNTTPVLPFTYPQDTWFDVVVTIDTEGSVMRIDIDGVNVANSVGINPGAILGGVNYYSINTNATYYVDDINIEQGDVVLSTFEGENTLFSIYPNPTNDLVRITSDEIVEAVVIRDVLGAQVANISSITSTVVTADLSGLETGVYFVTVELDGRFYTERIVKH